MKLWDAESLDELVARDFTVLSPAVAARTQRLAEATERGETVTESWTFYPKGRPVTVQAVISGIGLGQNRLGLLFEATTVGVDDSELRAVEALRHTSSQISLFDNQGRLAFANPAAFSTYGDGDLLSRFGDGTEGRDVFARVLEGETLAIIVEVETRRGRRSHHLDLRRVIDPVTGADGVLLSERDVSSQVSAEAALRASNEEMQRYTHMLSHDLRSPLVNIMGFSAELARMRTSLLGLEGPDSAATARDFDEALLFIRSSTERMDRLLAATLKLAREGRRKLVPADLDLDELVARLLKAHRHQVTSVQATVTVSALPSLRADPAAIEQVLGNLIDNAIKYRALDRPLRLAIEGERAGEHVEIVVSDNGCGIAPVDQERVFQPFQRAGPQTEPGEGVGLAYALALTRAMGGSISLNSTPDEGTRFIVRLPAGG